MKYSAERRPLGTIWIPDKALEILSDAAKWDRRFADVKSLIQQGKLEEAQQTVIRISKNPDAK